MGVADAILFVTGTYLALGAVVGLGFVTLGVSRADHAAQGSSIGFRLLILPGAIVLWPVVLRAWLRRSRDPGTEHAAEAPR